ncbi:hypothetical protein KM043_017442 [Ampulex compressa]|nr:hypothetical protein KM043_017442 [Ampulex compressa]
MRAVTLLSFIALCLVSGGQAKQGFGPGDQEWGYVQVRPHAKMFWWLYYTTANVKSYYEKPLVIWLQGGPGGSSTAYGNFEELGPLDANLKHRNYTWVKDYNVLFIDNPVGAGFSYATTTEGFATTNRQIALDLIECMKGFLKKLPAFATVPTYITTESYGGKMGAEFALLWHSAQTTGAINSNLKGVALGDAWISPVDSVMTWAPFLLQTGMIDTAGYNRINVAAVLTKRAADMGQWVRATNYWSYATSVILTETNNVDFYNILSKMKYTYRQADAYSSPLQTNGDMTFEKYESSAATLANLMNGPVKSALGVNVTHGAQSNAVFKLLWGDFMKPVTKEVELLLDTTDLKVFVYNGQMDLIVDTPGTLLWAEKLQWKNSNEWLNAEREPVVVDDIIEGYRKTYGNFDVYWVNRAGHMVPRDNPAAMGKILEHFTSQPGVW